MIDGFQLGWVPDFPDARDHRFVLSGAPPSLPARVSLRAQSVPIYTQALGDCASNAVSAMFRFVDKKQGGKDLTPSRLFLYYEARRLQGWQDRDSGTYIRDNLKVESSLGAAPETSWPYDPSKYTQSPPAASYALAEVRQVVEYLRLNVRLNDMKACLAAGYPFVLGSTLYDNFDEARTTGIVPMPAGSTAGGHALMYIGYDDSTRRFEVQGSWGTWGDGGFIYMPYDYAANDDLSADPWTIRSLEEEPVDPTPNPDHYLFAATVLVAKAGKIIVEVLGALPDIAQRRVIVSDGTLSRPGKIAWIDGNVMMIKKGDFSRFAGGMSVTVETTE